MIFSDFYASGSVMNNYANILELLLRLRQACDHPLLTFKPDASASGVTIGPRKTFSDIDQLLTQFFKDSNLSPAYLASLATTVQGLSADQDGPSDEAAAMECPICLEIPESPLLTPCGHLGCEECLSTVVTAISLCPVCRKPCQPGDLVRFETKARREPGPALEAAPPVRLSTKLKAVLNELDIMFREDAENKCIIFSQFTSMLDLVEVCQYVFW